LRIGYDASHALLLRDAPLQDMVGKPVFVIPFLRDLNLPEEDGLGIERRLSKESQLDDDAAPDTDPRSVVVVIAYPYMSMADDVLSLEHDSRFRVQWRRKCVPTWYPDAIVLPGSRIVCSDLRWMHETGWADYVRRHATHGGRVLGLCGGYQMLGTVVHDPLHVEGDIVSQRGLRLLPVETTLEAAAAKTVSPRSAKLLSSPVASAVRGFELHCGRTRQVPDDGMDLTSELPSTPLLEMDHDGSFDGLTNGRISGTYLHGILQSAEARVDLLVREDRKATIALAGGELESGDVQDPLDRLAEHLSSYGLTFDAIMRMLTD
jgi:adenosylcobyric acid synthase